MNLYIKYWPLLYTYHTRIFNLLGLQGYLYVNIGLWVLSVIYLYMMQSINIWDTCFLVFLFLLSYLCFTVLYEVGYLFNDGVIVKKEKKPTLRISEKLPPYFIANQIIIRLALWSLLLWLVYFYNVTLWVYLSCDLLWLAIVYSLHNIIRRYSINFFTIYFLRLLKFSIIVLVLLSFDFYGDYNLVQTVIIPLFVYFSLFRLYENIYIYNERHWGKNYLSNIEIYLYFIVTFALFFLITKVYFYILLIVFTWVTFVKIHKKWHFTLKSNR